METEAWTLSFDFVSLSVGALIEQKSEICLEEINLTTRLALNPASTALLPKIIQGHDQSERYTSILATFVLSSLQSEQRAERTHRNRNLSVIPW